MLSARGSGGSGTIPSVAATSGMDQSLANGAPVPAPGADRQEDRAMPKYVVLVNWTEQGAQSVQETTQRAQHVRQMIEQMGGRMDTLLWTQGRYDLVGIMEAPDEETAAAVGRRRRPPRRHE